MAEKQCPSCGREWPDRAPRCTCGHEFTEAIQDAERNRAKGKSLIGCGCASVLFLFMVLTGISLGGDPSHGTPGQWGEVVDTVWYWLPLLLLSAALLGFGTAKLKGPKAGVVVAAGWILLYFYITWLSLPAPDVYLRRSP